MSQSNHNEPAGRGQTGSQTRLDSGVGAAVGRSRGGPWRTPSPCGVGVGVFVVMVGVGVGVRVFVGVMLAVGVLVAVAVGVLVAVGVGVLVAVGVGVGVAPVTIATAWLLPGAGSGWSPLTTTVLVSTPVALPFTTVLITIVRQPLFAGRLFSTHATVGGLGW